MRTSPPDDAHNFLRMEPAGSCQGNADEMDRRAFSIRAFGEALCVVERVPGFVSQVHHDLALVLEIVHLFFKGGELRIRKVSGIPMMGSPEGHPHSSVR